MRRSSVRFRQASLLDTGRLTCENRYMAGRISWLFFAVARPSRTPGVPPRLGRLVQTVETGEVRRGAEEVQVPIGGGDRLVTHPGLDRSRVHATGQPQARRGVAQVVQPPTVACG